MFNIMLRIFLLKIIRRICIDLFEVKKKKNYFQYTPKIFFNLHNIQEQLCLHTFERLVYLTPFKAKEEEKLHTDFTDSCMYSIGSGLNMQNCGKDA